MAKNKKSQKPKKNVTEAVTPSDFSIETETQNQVNEIDNSEETVETKQVAVEKEQDNKKQNNSKDNDKNKKDKEGKNKKKPKKEKGKLKRKTKETFSELKKVTWPTFGEVCKKTGVVLVVVLIFAVVIFGIDYCLGLLVGLLR